MRHGKGATGSDPVQKGGRIASKSIPGAMLKIFFHPGVRQFSFCFLFRSDFCFVFFSWQQLQKHFNERWKISCCLRKGFYSTPFPQFSRWYRTVKDLEIVMSGMKVKIKQWRLNLWMMIKIKFRREIWVSCNDGIFWREERLQVSRENAIDVSWIGLRRVHFQDFR